MILSSERNYCRTQVWWNGRARLYLSVLPEWTIVRCRVIPCQLTQLIPPDPLQISSNLVYVVIWSEKDKMSNMSAIGRSVCELCHAHFSRFSLKWPRTSIRKRLYLRNLWAKSVDIGVYGKLIPSAIHICHHFLCRSNLTFHDLYIFTLTLNLTFGEEIFRDLYLVKFVPQH